MGKSITAMRCGYVCAMVALIGIVALTCIDATEKETQTQSLDARSAEGIDENNVVEAANNIVQKVHQKEKATYARVDTYVERHAPLKTTDGATIIKKHKAKEAAKEKAKKKAIWNSLNDITLDPLKPAMQKLNTEMTGETKETHLLHSIPVTDEGL